MSYLFSKGNRLFGDIEFEDDTDTQIDFEDNYIGLVVGGATILAVSGSAVGIGTDDPDNTLHVKSSGTTHIKVESEDGYEAALRLKAGTGGSTYVWTPGNTSDIRFYAGGDDRMHIDNDGKVGIGTTDPDYTLDVAGNAGFDEYIYHNGDANTYIRFKTDEIIIAAGGSQMITTQEGAGGHQADKVIINSGNGDIDFQVKGDNEANLIRTDAAIDMVGIRTDAPTDVLDINSDSIRIRTAQTPASATATGVAGRICWDSNYLYICTATDTWKRISLDSW